MIQGWLSYRMEMLGVELKSYNHFFGYILGKLNSGTKLSCMPFSKFADEHIMD